MATEQTHQGVTPTSAPLPPKKMGRWRASYLLTIEGLELLKKDKQVLLFPILSGLASFGIILLFCVLGFLFGGFGGAEEGVADNTGIGYGIALLLYLGLAFVATFFQAGLTAIVDARINGRSMSFQEGVGVASAHAEKIFIWSVIAATVGVILGFISSRSKWLGKLVSFFLSAAWGIITFFIVPALILEEESLPNAIKSSANTFKKTWGETLIMNFSAGLFLGLVAFLGILFTGLLMTLAIVFLAKSAAIAIFFLLLFLLILFLVGISVVSSAINSIFRVVLYEYAKSGHIADTFAPELILGALKKSS